MLKRGCHHSARWRAATRESSTRHVPRHIVGAHGLFPVFRRVCTRRRFRFRIVPAAGMPQIRGCIWRNSSTSSLASQDRSSRPWRSCAVWSNRIARIWVHPKVVQVVMSAIVRCGLGTIGLVLLSATVVGAQSPASSPQAPAAQKPPPGSPSGKPDARELANQVNNPAAPVTLLQFRNLLFPSVEGTDGATNALEIQPVLPIGPFASFRYLQLHQDHPAVPVAAVAGQRCGRWRPAGLRCVRLQGILGAVGSWTSAGVSYGIRQTRSVTASGRPAQPWR